MHIINELLLWPFVHPTAFWGLIFAFAAGMVVASGLDGRWRTWFDLTGDEE